MNGLSLTRRQIIEILGRLPLFKALGEETLENLAIGTRQVQVVRNEFVLQKGDLATSMHMVVGGQVRTYLPLSNGSEKVIATVGPGEAFGLAAACLSASHPANVMANRDSHLLVIDRHVLMREARCDCSLAWSGIWKVARPARHRSGSPVFSCSTGLTGCMPMTFICRQPGAKLPPNSILPMRPCRVCSITCATRRLLR
jgi:Cyclic nucleotide-binding domain